MTSERHLQSLVVSARDCDRERLERAAHAAITEAVRWSAKTDRKVRIRFVAELAEVDEPTPY